MHATSECGVFVFGGEERDRRGSIKIHPNCKGR